jgi:hypothetical protein
MKERMLVRRILETTRVVVLLPDTKSPDGLEVSIYEGGDDWGHISLPVAIECTAPATEAETKEILAELGRYWEEDPMLDHVLIGAEALTQQDLIPHRLPTA